jgi:hypothetical protein
MLQSHRDHAIVPQLRRSATDQLDKLNRRHALTTYTQVDEINVSSTCNTEERFAQVDCKSTNSVGKRQREHMSSTRYKRVNE